MLSTTTLVIWTLALAAAIVLALALYLIAIAYYLYRAGGSNSSHLARLAGGLEAIATNTEPLAPRLTTVAGALLALRDGLADVAVNLSRARQALR